MAVAHNNFEISQRGAVDRAEHFKPYRDCAGKPLLPRPIALLRCCVAPALT